MTMNRNKEIERIIRLVHDSADDHVLRECIGVAFDKVTPNVYDVLESIRELEKLPVVQAYLALLRSLKNRGVN